MLKIHNDHEVNIETLADRINLFLFIHSQGNWSEQMAAITQRALAEYIDAKITNSITMPEMGEDFPLYIDGFCDTQRTNVDLLLREFEEVLSGDNQIPNEIGLIVESAQNRVKGLIYFTNDIQKELGSQG